MSRKRCAAERYMSERDKRSWSGAVSSLACFLGRTHVVGNPKANCSIHFRPDIPPWSISWDRATVLSLPSACMVAEGMQALHWPCSGAGRTTSSDRRFNWAGQKLATASGGELRINPAARIALPGRGVSIERGNLRAKLVQHVVRSMKGVGGLRESPSVGIHHR